ncbi:cytochrome P450 [Phlebopus sp. FC_14]|nr:cytochrome P450 [Phlebopus sp. FC_14]
MPVSGWTVASVIALLCAFLGHKYLGKHKNPSSSFPLPPGPPGLPIVGNVLGINVDAPWLTYSEWAKKYGDIKVAHDLLEARSNIYSGRPYVAGNDILGTDFNTAFKPYGSEWRLHRKLLHQSFKPDSIPRFHAMQQRKARQLLRHILESPELYQDHVMEYSSSVIMHATYGYETTPRCDELVDLIVRTMEYVVGLLQPEATLLLSAYPSLLKLPSWFFGMEIKRVGAKGQKMVKDCLEIPFEHALRRKHGNTASAMVLDALQKEDTQHSSAAWMQTLKAVSVTAFGALLTFVLAMAQAQIYAVIEKDRLPTLEDRASLPYIDAIFRETLRWHPVIPLSIPHATVETDVYQGYYIPKGFKHWLRICPGRYFANASVWIVMASILAMFKMAKAKDNEGHDIPINVTWSKGLTSRPLPFPCSVSPRFEGLDTETLERMISVGADMLVSQDLLLPCT